VFVEPRAQSDLRDYKEMVAHRAFKDFREFRAFRVTRVTRVSRVSKDSKASRVSRAQLEQRDPLQMLLARRVLKGFKAIPVH
jgi:hypothetical protein